MLPQVIYVVWNYQLKNATAAVTCTLSSTDILVLVIPQNALIELNSEEKIFRDMYRIRICVTVDEAEAVIANMILTEVSGKQK